MLYNVDFAGNIVGTRYYSPKKYEIDLAESDPTWVYLESPLLEPINCYVLVDGEFSLVNGWEAIKEAILHEAEASQIESKFSALKYLKEQEIKNDFDTESMAPVVDANNITWNGGLSSATVIGGKADKEEYKGMTEVTLFDYSNSFHTMTIDEARQLAAMISDQYELALFKYKTRQNALADVTDGDTGALSAI